MDAASQACQQVLEDQRAQRSQLEMRIAIERAKAEEQAAAQAAAQAQEEGARLASLRAARAALQEQREQVRGAAGCCQANGCQHTVFPASSAAYRQGTWIMIGSTGCGHRLPSSQLCHTVSITYTKPNVAAQVADVLAKVAVARSALADCGYDPDDNPLQQPDEQALEDAAARAVARELTSATVLVTQQGAPLPLGVQQARRRSCCHCPLSEMLYACQQLWPIKLELAS